MLPGASQEMPGQIRRLSLLVLQTTWILSFALMTFLARNSVVRHLTTTLVLSNPISIMPILSARRHVAGATFISDHRAFVWEALLIQRTADKGHSRSMK